MNATHTPDSPPAGAPDDMDRAAHRDFRGGGGRRHRGCGWHFGEHFDRKFGDKFGDRFSERFGERVGARLAERFGAGGRGGWHHVPVDIEDTSDAFVLSLFAARLDKPGISLGVQNDVLTIRYRAPQAADDSQARRFTRRESRSADFMREFALNGKVRIDAIEASYADGVLTVRLPKTPQAMQPEHTIVVQ